MKRAPALFLSHGSPMFALEPGMLGSKLRKLGAAISGVKAILVVSPHWQTGDVRVMASAEPGTLHDFDGFPAELDRVRYGAPGAPELARIAEELLAAAGFKASVDAQRGLDHGAWVPLLHFLPAAEIPVFQVSMPYDLDTHGALKLGAALRPLRDQQVMVIGSGSMTHNLHEFFRGTRDAAYAHAFADWVGKAVGRRDIEALVGYRRLAPQAERAHPTEEHYLPLLFAVGATHEDEPLSYLQGGMTAGVLSMDSFAWGAAREVAVSEAPALAAA